MVESNQEKVKFFDPHFHLVDRTDGPSAVDFWTDLYPTSDKFLINDYENLVLADGANVELLGGVFVEAVAKQEKRLEEALWVDKVLD